MMTPITSKFNELRLRGMSRSWESLVETRQHQDLTLSEGLEILLHAEKLDREQRRFERLTKNARFRYQASIDELNLDSSRGIDKTLLASLATGTYLKNGESVIITGATGCGKSFIASALGHQACAQGYKTAYFNMQKLTQKLKITRLEGTVLSFFMNIAKTDLLILDDFGLTHLEKQQQLDLMEIIEDRHARHSTIIISQLPVASWFEIIGEATIADAILDRLVHTSHRIQLKGESLRKIK
ncbi:IS21-like element helper ATPase IstB [Membranihabitans marinus]|uniref:IS21-like element helper ATPase IstB n=1 Tax=Membranihabitans marinus TaxID=1227546 RepID=UPI001EFFC89E|nr:IS21-like element helper ATPase IstB [Membranihabitans marinus]